MCQYSSDFKKHVIFLILIISILFLSCNNTTPSIGNVSTSIIYDYSENKENPTAKIAVFVELFSDSMRIKDITITSPNNDYSWKIEEPVCFNNSNSIMLGSSNIMPVQNENFPNGVYSLVYTDIAQRTTKVTFSVPVLLQPTEDDLQKNTKKMCALYDKNNNLLYYGNRNQREIDSIKNDFLNAKTMYEVLVLEDNKTAIIEKKIEI